MDFLPDAATITALGGALAAVILALKAKSDTRAQKKSLDNIEKETSPDSGNSMKDKINYTAAAIDTVKTEIIALKEANIALKSENVELGRVDLQDREAALLAHQQIYNAIAVDRNAAELRHRELSEMMEKLLAKEVA